MVITINITERNMVFQKVLLILKETYQRLLVYLTYITYSPSQGIKQSEDLVMVKRQELILLKDSIEELLGKEIKD